MNKGITITKRIIVIAMAILLLLLSFVGIFTICVNGSKKGTASASYKITDNAVISNSDYNANSVFEIGTKNGLKGFAATVSSGKDFYDKTVKLTSDIKCKYPKTSNVMPSIGYLSNEDESYDGVPNSVLFRGTFDGQGYKIYSFKMEFTNPSVADDWGYEYDGSFFIRSAGFFAGLGDGGKIKNLELYDFEFKCKCDGSNTFAFGGLVGYIPYKAYNVKIENCVVNGFKITKSDNFKGFGYVGGLVGLQDSQQSSVMIENCYVGDFTLNIDNLDVSMIYAGGLVGRYRPTNPNVTMVKCVFNSPSSNITFTNNHHNTRFWNNICCIRQWGGERQISSSIPSSCYASTSGNFSQLAKSANGGETDGTNYWYYDNTYCSQYNNGFPLLRNSVTWKTYNIQANDGGSININSFVIPSTSEYVKVLTGKFSNSQYNQNVLSIGEQSVIATPSTGYEFIYYSISGTNITAQFQRKPVRINFVISTTNSHYIAKLNGNTQSSGLTYTVDYGTTVSVSSSDYYIEYQFSSSGNTYTILYECNDNKYYLKEKVNKTITITEQTEFNPTFSLKEYSVVFE